MTNLWTVLYFTIGISCTGLMLLVFKKIFQDKLSARWHYLVWLVLLVRTILPANVRLLSTDFSLNNLWMEGMKQLRGTVELGRNSVLSSPFGMGGGDVSLLRELPFAMWSATDILFCVYVAGVVAFLLYDVVVYILLRREISRGRDASLSLRAKTAAAAEKYDLPKQERIKVCKGFETPFLCGFFKPVLVVPEGMEESIDEKVLLHEILHLKHRDVLVNFALHLLRALNWFNPLVYLLCRIIRNDSEALCDQRALEKLEGEEKREYGILLLNMADSRHSSRIGTTSMANGAKNIKTRVQRIADFGRAPKGAAFATACITAVLCMASVSFGYEPKYLETLEARTKEDLEMLLEDARYFHVTSAEMAINLFAEALSEQNMVKMALIVPMEHFDAYKAWALEKYNEDYLAALQPEGADPEYDYGLYWLVENGVVYITDYEEDSFVEGIFHFRKENIEDEPGIGEAISFRGENTEAGWKIKVLGKQEDKYLGSYFLSDVVLQRQMAEGDYDTFTNVVGDWRYTMARWCSSMYWTGDGFAGLNFEMFGSPQTEQAFSETLKLYTNFGVYVEYVGENWPLETWQEEMDKEVPLFYVCPKEITDEEIWEAHDGSREWYNTGSGGSSSNGSGWSVPLIKENGDWVVINGDLYGETIGEAMEHYEREYEFRIYSRQGKRLLTVSMDDIPLLDPVERGTFHE